MRLIDADAFIEENKDIIDCEIDHPKYQDTLRDLINNAPTVEARQHGEWIPITYRPMDEEEYEEFRKEFGEIPIEDRKMFSCHMPEDDQEILICTSWGGVSLDMCEIDELYGYVLETHGDWDGVTAWRPLPEPYKRGEAE